MNIMVGGTRKHTDYLILNNEWVLMNNGSVVGDTLSVYMSIRLDIRAVTGIRDLGRFHGISDYYVRNCYGLEYRSCKSDGGIVNGVYVKDPWNRQFKVFPYARNGGNGLYRYEGYYSGVVNNTVYGDEIKIDRRHIMHNVILLTTSVNGRCVYCVDILSGTYKNR